MLPTTSRHVTPLSVKSIMTPRTFAEDQPSTPSKRKGYRRRPVAIYAAVLMCMVLAGGLLTSGAFMPPTSDGVQVHRRSLVDRMQVQHSLAPQRTPRAIANSEARQREALEIADTFLTHSHKQNGVLALDGEDSAAGTGIASWLTPPELGAVDAEPQRQQKGPSPPVPMQDSHENMTAFIGPPTVKVMQVLSSGEERQLEVDAARYKFLQSLSKGVESEEYQQDAPSVHQSWWSNKISADGALVPPVTRPPINNSAAIAAAAALRAEQGLDEADVVHPEDDQCKIYVLDVNKELGPSLGMRPCDLTYKRVWPFSRHGYGIDGVQTLFPEHYQYSNEYWLSEAIRKSSRAAPDLSSADFVFVDMWCYHTAWLAYVHPLGSQNMTDSASYIRRGVTAVTKLDRFSTTRGSIFAMVHPSPLMQNLFSEAAMCEDLAGVFHLVPERSSLCVWTKNAAVQGRAAVIPYVASLDLDVQSNLETTPRDIFLFFRGGCGHPDPSVRQMFAAGKMLRYEFVQAVTAAGEADMQATCSCDICDNHMPHQDLQASYRRSRFCPVLASNVQSSRRLSEVIMAGCIPVFIGPPFHALPLVGDVDYASMGIFINVTNSDWIDMTSANFLQNSMVTKVWPLEDAAAAATLVEVASLQEALRYLRNIPRQLETMKRRAVLRERWKLYYSAKPIGDGGDGQQSELAELLMQKMCRRAAASKRKMAARNEKNSVSASDRNVKLKLGEARSHGWHLFVGGGDDDGGR